MIERLTGGAFVSALAARLRPPAAPLPAEAWMRRAEGWRTDLPLAAELDLAGVAVEGGDEFLQTPPLRVIVSGGIGDHTVAWQLEPLAGPLPNIDAQGASATSFSTTIASLDGEVRTALASAIVTDEFGNSVETEQVPVELQRWSVPRLTAPAAKSINGTTSQLTIADLTAQLQGGTGPFAISWHVVSGSGVTVASPDALQTDITMAGVPEGVTGSATVECVVTDANGLSTAIRVTLSFTHLAPLAVSIDTALLVVSGTSVPLQTARLNVTAQGGAGGYSYETFRVDGANLDIRYGSGSRPAFRASPAAGQTLEGRYRTRVTDADGTSQLSPIVTARIRNTSATSGNTGGGSTDGTSTPPPPNFTPQPGDHFVFDENTAQFTVSASRTVRFNYVVAGAAVSASKASNSTGTSITFTLSRGTAESKDSTVSLTCTDDEGRTFDFTIQLTVFFYRHDGGF